jgi:ATP-grasp domain
MAPKILLTDTSRWPNAARLAVVLVEAGCSVSGVCPLPHHPLSKVKKIQKLFRYRSLRPLDSLAEAIKAAAPEIIVPCDDRAVQHLHELHSRTSLRQLESPTVSLIERSLGSPESYPIASSRYSLLELAREERLRVPKTKLIKSLADVKAWCSEETLPVVLKADGTWGGNGVKIAQTPAQAETFFTSLVRMPRASALIKRLLLDRDRFWLRPSWRRAKPSVIAQAFVHGRPANCAAVCWEGRILAALGVEVVSTARSEGPATVVRVVENPEMTFAAEKLARRLRLSGFFGLDFMIEEGSGSTYLIEMNPRCTKLCHLQLGKGRDMAAALRAQMAGLPLQETPSIVQNQTIAYFPEAWSYQSDFLQSSFADMPLGQIELIRELLAPSSERTVFGCILDKARKWKAGERGWAPAKEVETPSLPSVEHHPIATSTHSAGA